MFLINLSVLLTAAAAISYEILGASVLVNLPPEKIREEFKRMFYE